MRLILILLFSAISLSAFAEVDAEKVKKSELRIDRKATSYSGYFEGIRQKKTPSKFKIKDCQFIYEKGSDEHPDNQKEYKFDRFILNFLGLNNQGESAFDSVSYTFSEYRENYKSLAFQRSFGPMSLVDVTKVASIGSPSMKFIKNGDRAEIIFEHTDIFDKTKNSSFFRPDEKRKIKSQFFFSKFNDKVIELEKVIVSAKRIKNKSIAISVTCSKFVD